MHAAQVTPGRRFMLLLEPGEDVLGAVERWCGETGVRQAIIPMFYGAFRSARLIAAERAPEDPEVPLPESVTVPYVEGVGGGTISPYGDGVRVHLHVSAGRKDEGGRGYAGHLLGAEVHYMTEVVVDEITAPAFRLQAEEASYGLECLRFGESAQPLR